MKIRNYEGKINNEDLNILLNNWAPLGPVPTPNPDQRKADLNEDQKVNETDLTILLSNWNP
ncbi:MAG: dockerin type I domain-containing protein [Microgenomates group bacterium]